MRPYILNHRRGGSIGVLFRFLLVFPLWALLVVLVFFGLILVNYTKRVPPVPNLWEVEEGRFTEIRARDGVRIAGAVRGRRPWLHYEHIPPQVVLAFLAAEDDTFFTHDGVDPNGILRALWINIRRGGIRQGGSTITQQVAREYLSREKTIDRKTLEILLARRIEAVYTKTEILEVYLNRVYLGAGAYGVEAAAEIYFGTSVDCLTLPEAALIAGLASAPSLLNPWHNPKGALQRRKFVLSRLLDLGVIDQQEFEDAMATPLKLTRLAAGDDAPFVVGEVARRMRARFGDNWYVGDGVIITATTDRFAQLLARESLVKGTDALGRRQGWVGPLTSIEPAGMVAFRDETERIYGADPLALGQPVLAAVTKVEPATLTVAIAHRSYPVSLEDASWAVPYDPSSKQNNQTIEQFGQSFEVGDVIVVVPEGAKLKLHQFSHVEGGSVVLDLPAGTVLAMVGGVDYDRSQYNRITQSCRQPGSVFKPIAYSLALHRFGYTPATVIPDTPMRMTDDYGNLIWKPRNPDRDYKGAILLLDALAWSRNLPTIRIGEAIGYESIANWARRLGLTTDMRTTPSLVLGASCVNPWELTLLYGAFARRGAMMDGVLIESVVDPNGALLLDQGRFFAPHASTPQRLYRLLNDLNRVERPLLPNTTAYLTNFLLTMVVQRGTGRAARSMGVSVAGKTGTTNANDAWFIGYTPQYLATVWVGSDLNRRPLGRRENGSRVALPIFIDALGPLLQGLPQTQQQADLLVNPPDGIVFARIDPRSGKLAGPGRSGLSVPFRKGSEPTEESPAPAVQDMWEMDRLDREF